MLPFCSFVKRPLDPFPMLQQQWPFLPRVVLFKENNLRRRNMRFFVMAVALFVFVASGTNKAAAACNAICQAKCQRGWPNHTVAECILKWSCINEKYGKAASRFEGLHAPSDCAGLADLTPALQRFYQR
jgi:hypothetical protein